MNEKEKKLPRYFGARLPWNRRKLKDGTEAYKAYDLSNGPCLIIDNHWNTVIRIIMPSRKALCLAFKADSATAEEFNQGSVQKPTWGVCARLRKG